MKMDLDFDTVLEVALGGPEIGPLNLYVLHGLMKQLFDKLEISQKTLSIDEDDTYFSAGYNFIKSKVEEKQRKQHTTGGGYGRERSKVSVIVSDYVRTPIGSAPPTISEEETDEVQTPPRLLPADIEDRLRHVEAQLKNAKDFPSADELRSWAQEKTSPDTVVTDLWHFVSLNSRVNGAEEGIQKLTELIDRLIPELKKLHDEQDRLQGMIDDLYSQMKGLSDRATRVDERQDKAGQENDDKIQEMNNKMKEIEDQMKGCAKLMDLEDFLLAETFIEEKKKARELVNEMQDDIDSKMPMSMLDELKNRGREEIEKLQNEINDIQNNIDGFAKKDEIPEMETYVQWPQLEDALLRPASPPVSNQSSRNSSRQEQTRESVSQEGEDSLRYTPSPPLSHRSNSSTPHRSNSRTGSLIGTYEDIEVQDGNLTTSPHGSRPTSSISFAVPPSDGKTRSDSRSSQKSGRNSVVENEKSTSNDDGQEASYPTNACINKLHEIAKLPNRHKELKDAIEDIREQLYEKANKSDLDRFLTQDDLQDLLGVLHTMREELNELKAWRNLVDDEKVPALRAVLDDLEKQVSDLMKKLSEVTDEQEKQQDAINALHSCTDRLEESKLDKTDLPEFPKTNPKIDREISAESFKSVSTKDLERRESQERKDSYTTQIPTERSDSKEKIYLPPIQMKDMSTMESLPNNNKQSIDETDMSDFVNRPEFLAAIEQLRRSLENLLNKFDDHESDYRKKISSLLDKLDNKIDREELDPLREYLENRYQALLQQQQDQLVQDQKMNKRGKQSPSRGKSSRGSPSYGTPYVMDTTECSHPQYGDGGFIPQKKQAAAFKKQMKFNCLSCDRPLTLETNSHLQTIRGRPLNAYELDQLRLLQRILKGDKESTPTRACGGRHTSGIQPGKRISARYNPSAMSLPTMSHDNNDHLLIDGEVDIEGLDGRLYRGLISKKDLNHARTKSANAQLRTVSPLPTMNGDKSRMDYNSSYGSIDIPVGY